jgi:hypothetical protein
VTASLLDGLATAALVATRDVGDPDAVVIEHGLRGQHVTDSPIRA